MHRGTRVQFPPPPLGPICETSQVGPFLWLTENLLLSEAPLHSIRPEGDGAIPWGEVRRERDGPFSEQCCKLRMLRKKIFLPMF